MVRAGSRLRPAKQRVRAAVENAATTVPLSARMGRPSIVPFVPRRLPHAQGYELITAAAEGLLDDETRAAAMMNRVVEEQVLLAPDQYMAAPPV